MPRTLQNPHTAIQWAKLQRRFRGLDPGKLADLDLVLDL